MKKLIYTFLVSLLVFSAVSAQESRSKAYPFCLEFDSERTLLKVFPTPAGYERFPISKMTKFMAWVTNLPLAPKYHPVVRWDKQIIMRADSMAGVVGIGIASTNQKDADLPLQLVMEYLRARGGLGDFPIIVMKRDTLMFDRWLNGKYSFDARKNLIYKKEEMRESTEREFYRYMEFVIRLNENKILLENLTAINEKNIQPGDLFIQFDENDSDSTGHSAMILDVCSNKKGDLLLLIGMGGTPAQSFYIPQPRPLSDRKWFTIDELKNHLVEYGDGRFYRFLNLTDR